MDKVVGAAVELGWLVAELYSEIRPEDLAAPETPPAAKPAAATPAPQPLHLERPKLSPDLPGASDLHVVEKRTLLHDQLAVALGIVTPSVVDVGLTLPPAPDVVALASSSSKEEKYQAGLTVRNFHVEVMSALRATQVSLGDAYGLGRALADVTLWVDPDALTLDSLRNDLRVGRVDTLHDRLSSLKSALPDHAAGGVIASLEAWQRWAALSAPSWLGSSVADPTPTIGAVTRHAVALGLRKQGRLWREALTGEENPLDHLSADDYVEAGGYLIGRMRRILGHTLRQYAWYLVGAVVLVAALAVAAFVSFPGDVGKTVSAAVAVLAGLGVTTKSLSSAFTRAMGKGETYLWGAELDLAVARAITVSPDVAAQVVGEASANKLVTRAARQRADAITKAQTVRAADVQSEPAEAMLGRAEPPAQQVTTDSVEA